jgi:hypothetical protein
MIEMAGNRQAGDFQRWTQIRLAGGVSAEPFPLDIFEIVW